SSTSRIPTNAAESGGVDRYFSYYANASVDYDHRYVLSLSARKDASNLFGVKANQRAVPLWSAGLLWNIHGEEFYNISWLSKLQWRATYGYTGNVDKSVSALLTSTTGSASSNGINHWGSYYTEIRNPPNPSLRWEKINKINAGLAFELLNARLSGSVDYFYHHANDLIGDSPIAPQTGLTTFRGNSARTKTDGFDIVLRSQNIRSADFVWTTHWLLNWIKDEVVEYKAEKGSNRMIVESNWTNPLEGYPYNSMFSFAWSGLNEEGQPVGILHGEESVNYSAIRNLLEPSQLIFHGAGTPTSYGSIRNEFQFGSLNFSFNILYKFGYFYRNRNIFNGGSYGYRQEKFADRWQNPGDEAITDIPAITYPTNSNRINFYSYSEATVERGDHIRLQDIQLSYRFAIGRPSNKSARNLDVYAYANNLGILWRAN